MKNAAASLAALAALATNTHGYLSSSSSSISSSRRATTTTSIILPRRPSFVRMTDGGEDPIVSPFDDSSDSGGVATSTSSNEPEEYLELTWENVDKVLDEMRPYLIQDGGNVKIAEIDGPVVRLQLEVC